MLNMKQRPKIFYSEGQKAMMWDRWQRGDSIHDIARLFDRGHSSVQRILCESGGIRPAQRARSKLALSILEREEISRGVVAGRSMRAIAASLGRAASTVSRELKRNGGCQGYRASKADQAAWDQAHRPKSCKLARNHTLARIVAQKLKMLWSPEQIAGWLKCTYPQDESYQVSHETIYRTLFIQARGALKKELLQHLRRTRVMRRSRHYTQKRDAHGRISNTISISERPPSVEDRAVPGHWEGDLIFGSNNSQIAPLVERQTRFKGLVGEFHRIPKNHSFITSADNCSTISATRISRIRCAIPTWHRIDSKDSGETELITPKTGRSGADWLDPITV
jgi:IS30 family transposase